MEVASAGFVAFDNGPGVSATSFVLASGITMISCGSCARLNRKFLIVPAALDMLGFQRQ